MPVEKHYRNNTLNEGTVSGAAGQPRGNPAETEKPHARTNKEKKHDKGNKKSDCNRNKEKQKNRKKKKGKTKKER